VTLALGGTNSSYKPLKSAEPEEEECHSISKELLSQCELIKRHLKHHGKTSNQIYSISVMLFVPNDYCACISTLSAAETLAAVLFSSNGPVIDMATAPIGAVTTIARTATVNSCITHTP